jgi:hypothetical protein
MKRFIQIVAVAVGFLLVAQPALANASCSHLTCGSDLSASKCCMHAGDMPMPGMSSNDAKYAMDSMSAGCQTMWRAALTEPGCVVEAVCTSPVSLTPQLVAVRTSKTTNAVAATSLPEFGADVLPAFAPPPPGVAVASASAKYILFSVFRI